MDTKKIIKILIVLLTMTTLGCVSYTSPPNDVGFDNKADIRELVGRYKNLGESSKFTKGPFYLSKIIWNSDNNLRHAAIEIIEVAALDDKTIKVKAITKQKLYKEEIFVEGVDFEMVDGRIRVLRESGAYKDRSVIVGPYSEKADIGIDLRGDGKYRYSGSGAGLVYLIIPIAASEGHDVRFVRIK